MSWISLILSFALHIAPNVGLTLALAMALPKQCVELRIALYVVAYVVMRDTMTPFGIWRLGNTNGVIWIEFLDSPELHIILAIASFIFIGIFRILDPTSFALIVFRSKRSVADSLLSGIAGAALLAATTVFARMTFAHDPIAFYRSASPRPMHVHASTLSLCIMGNLLEETLFRGMLQGYLETLPESISPVRAAILSGVFSGVFYTFLAGVVTTIGMPVLLFGLFTGFVCAFVRLRSGVFASTLSHGLAMFALVSGLI